MTHPLVSQMEAKYVQMRRFHSASDERTGKWLLRKSNVPVNGQKALA